MVKKVANEDQLTKEEIQVFIDCRTANIDNLTILGDIEYNILQLEEQKWEKKSEIKKIEEKYLSHLENIKKKYGEVNIDLETGKLTKITETPEAVIK
jgi:DNA-directed RNA polymerase